MSYAIPMILLSDADSVSGADNHADAVRIVVDDLVYVGDAIFVEDEGTDVEFDTVVSVNGVPTPPAYVGALTQRELKAVEEMLAHYEEREERDADEYQRENGTTEGHVIEEFKVLRNLLARHGVIA